MEKRVLIGAGVNDELAREAEAADLACREEQLQRAIEAAQSEESYRPSKSSMIQEKELRLRNTEAI